MTLHQALEVLRRYQRHKLLREFDDTGHVPPENLEVSAAIDLLIDASVPEIGVSPPMSGSQ